MTILTCRQVSRRYLRPGLEPIVAVDRADLDVEAAEFVAVEGPSGSGKTTLLGLLAGLELPDGGTVELLGHDLRRLSATDRARLRRRQVGIVFQSFGLIAALNAGENVGLPLTLDGLPESERRARVAAALEDVGLGQAAGARIDELSGGERQRVGVARALVTNPAVILADEPTGSLDGENSGLVLALLTDAVRRRRSALVLVTHDPLSAGHADRRYGIRDGHLRAEGAA